MGKNMILVIVSLAVCVAMLEAFLFLMPVYQSARAPVERVYCAGPERKRYISERFGRTETPGTIFFERRMEAEDWSLNFVNSMGFRDLYNHGKQNVIVLGDSFTQGALVSNHDNFTGLLDRWQPDIAFHNFGIGGYGTTDAVRTYRTIAGDRPHELVILAYFVGNDLTDNLDSGYTLENGKPTRPADQDQRRASPPRSPLMSAHVFLSHQLRSYRQVYDSLRRLTSMSRSQSPAENARLAQGERLTDALLEELADLVASSGADLLITILPSWNERIDDDARRLADRQRALIEALADEREGVNFVDLAKRFEEQPRDQLFGRVDTHYARLGQYLTAAGIADWLTSNWKHPGVEVKPAPAYRRVADLPIEEPDCGMVAGYRERFLTPPGVRHDAALQLDGSAP